MGISRDSRHKRRATGGRKANLKKKRLYESGRPPAMTKLGPKRIHELRVRGGNTKQRALRLDTGNFSWGTEGTSRIFTISTLSPRTITVFLTLKSSCPLLLVVVTRKARIIDVRYNASNNELVRTKTLVKNSIIEIDAIPFRQWYEQHYGVKIGAKKGKKTAETEEEVKKSRNLVAKLTARQSTRTLDPMLDDAFASGRLLACIASRPGQSGRCDGYILEGKELEFYSKMLKRKGK